jgi:hypothetical protein
MAITGTSSSTFSNAGGAVTDLFAAYGAGKCALPRTVGEDIEPGARGGKPCTSLCGLLAADLHGGVALLLCLLNGCGLLRELFILLCERLGKIVLLSLGKIARGLEPRSLGRNLALLFGEPGRIEFSLRYSILLAR